MNTRNEYYIDELTFNSFIYILGKSNKYKFYVLENKRNTFIKLLFWLLTKFNYDLCILDFFAGHLKNGDGETVTVAAVRGASFASVDILKRKNYSSFLSKFIPSNYDSNVIDVFLSKLLYNDLYYIFLRSMVVQSLSDNENPMLVIKRPKKINPTDLEDNYNLVKLDFYNSIEFFIVKLFKSYFHYYVTKSLKILSNYFCLSKEIKINTSLPSVLSIQSNTLRNDLSLRGEPNWIDRSNNSPRFNTIILSSSMNFFKVGHTIPISDDFETLKENNVFSIPNHSIAQIPDIKKFIKFLFTWFDLRNEISGQVKYYLLEFYFVLLDALDYEEVVKKYNIKLVYFSESAPSESICLISKKLQFKTLAQQYSNLPFFSVIMTGKVDKFLLSSNIFEKCFNLHQCGPVSFKSTGYCYSYAHKYITERAKAHRVNLSDQGVKFIICYFDERVCFNNKWGTIENDSHLIDLTKLVEFVIDNPSLGLVVKSQFMKYSPSNWYRNEIIFKKAINSRRYIELNEGGEKNRNDILPTEAALIADICISQKLGATAGLESAILQKRTLLMNKYPINTVFDDLYLRSQIVFNSMDEIIHAIKEFRLGNKDYLNLGDWSPIINEFNNFQDLDNLVRVRHTIEEMTL